MLFIIIIFFQTMALNACQIIPPKNDNHQQIVTGAERTEHYLPELNGKRIALVANHTSLVGGTHLLDSLLAHDLQIIKVFSPEHGFRGDADAGDHIAGGIDSKTGVAVVSLYGSKKKPTQDDLNDLDLVIFDIQDVGVRFYTYISTMSLVMEACAEKGIPFMVFDRPNPNGFYVDGPVMETGFLSFVGLHPVPVVYGMTMAEYALMVNGEGWLAEGIKCRLKIIRMKNYTHKTLYELPVKPSPNLPDMTSVYLYPSICFFEGTIMSVGRGTEKPFRIIGHPDYTAGNIEFTPVSTPGASLNPLFKNELCKGTDYSFLAADILISKQLNIQPLIDVWNYFKNKNVFFNNYFDKLAGNQTLREQIQQGLSENEIREGWQPEIEKFLKIRKKYLIYE